MPTLDLGSVVGPPGPQGEIGPQGAVGTQGPPGAAATINGVNTLTLTAGDNITLKQDGSALEIGAVVPGKNLLINSDFRKPVNRNGKTEYMGPGYTIDSWFIDSGVQLLAANDGIHLTSDEIWKSCAQLIDSSIAKELIKRTFTFSVLAKIQSTDSLRLSIYDSTNNFDTDKIINGTNEWDVISITIADISNYNANSIRVIIGGILENSVIKAAILEEGDHQTHFRQNESGEWEIIDPVDYDTQYLLCSQYSPITGEWVGSQHVNENLLDNSYWALLAAIVNQKNKTTYGPFSTSKQFTIDRWFIQSNSAYITLNEPDQCLDLHTGTVVSWDGIEQTVDLNRDFIGKQLTLSALLRGEVGKKFRIAARVTNAGFFFQTSLVGTGNWELATLTFTVPENSVSLSVSVAGEATVEDKTISIKACQLELGPISTLAHKEGGTWIINRCRPDYALELAKCQRYQVGKLYGNIRMSAVWANGMDFIIPVPVTMRGNPTFSNAEPIVKSSTLTVQPGFTFESIVYPGYIRVIATKQAHGLTDASLTVDNVFLDANL